MNKGLIAAAAIALVAWYFWDKRGASTVPVFQPGGTSSGVVTDAPTAASSWGKAFSEILGGLNGSSGSAGSSSSSASGGFTWEQLTQLAADTVKQATDEAKKAAQAIVQTAAPAAAQSGDQPEYMTD